MPGPEQHSNRALRGRRAGGSASVAGLTTRRREGRQPEEHTACGGRAPSCGRNQRCLPSASPDDHPRAPRRSGRRSSRGPWSSGEACVVTEIEWNRPKRLAMLVADRGIPNQAAPPSGRARAHPGSRRTRAYPARRFDPPHEDGRSTNRFNPNRHTGRRPGGLPVACPPASAAEQVKRWRKPTPPSQTGRWTPARSRSGGWPCPGRRGRRAHGRGRREPRNRLRLPAARERGGSAAGPDRDAQSAKPTATAPIAAAADAAGRGPADTGF
jgi:hypothetical protein